MSPQQMSESMTVDQNVPAILKGGGVIGGGVSVVFGIVHGVAGPVSGPFRVYPKP